MVCLSWLNRTFLNVKGTISIYAAAILSKENSQNVQHEFHNKISPCYIVDSMYFRVYTIMFLEKGREQNEREKRREGKGKREENKFLK
jgi:hypothetical protein